MAELIQSHETLPSSELLSSSQETVGVQARLLLGSDALRLDNITLAPATKDTLSPAHIDYAKIDTALQKVSNDYWKDTDPSVRKITWIADFQKRFTDYDTFWQGTKGKAWVETFKKIDFNPSDITTNTTAIDTFYDTYISPSNKTATEKFSDKVLETYTKGDGNFDYDKLMEDKKAINWLAGVIDGSKLDIVGEIITARANHKEKPNELIAAVNHKAAGQDTTRLNDPTPKEVAIMTLLHTPDQYLIDQPRLPSPDGSANGGQAQPAPLSAPSTPDDNTPSPETDEQKVRANESLAPQDKKDIIEGKGFEVIDRIGWDAYRNVLATISYKDMINAQSDQIERLQKEADELPPPISGDALQQANDEASQKVAVMRQTLPQQYRGNPDISCFDDPNAQKLTVRGKKVRSERDQEVTRLYFHTYNRTTPEAFTSLIEALQEEQALDTLDVALYVENFIPGSEQNTKVLQHNNIIMYVHDRTPEIMEKIAKAVNTAKITSPKAWEMHPTDEAYAKELMMFNMNIPLDDTTGFVEAPDLHSFDTTHRERMGGEFAGSYNNRYQSIAARLAVLQRVIPAYNEQNPARFSDVTLARRRKNMPGLLFEEAQAVSAVPIEAMLPQTAEIHPEVNLTENMRAAHQFINILRDPNRFDPIPGDQDEVYHQFKFRLKKPVEHSFFNPSIMVDRLAQDRYHMPLAIYVRNLVPGNDKTSHAHLILENPRQQSDGTWQMKIYNPFNEGEEIVTLPTYNPDPEQGLAYGIHLNYLAAQQFRNNTYDLSISGNPKLKPYEDMFMTGKLAGLQKDSENCVPYTLFVGAMLNALQPGDTDFKREGITQLAEDFNIHIKTLEEMIPQRVVSVSSVDVRPIIGGSDEAVDSPQGAGFLYDVNIPTDVKERKDRLKEQIYGLRLCYTFFDSIKEAEATRLGLFFLFEKNKTASHIGALGYIKEIGKQWGLKGSVEDIISKGMPKALDTILADLEHMIQRGEIDNHFPKEGILEAWGIGKPDMDRPRKIKEWAQKLREARQRRELIDMQDLTPVGDMITIKRQLQKAA